MIKFEKPTVEQFFQTYVITQFTVTDDEKKLIFSSNLNGKMNVWAMDMDRGYPYMFGHTEKSCSFLKADPKERFVLGGFDRDGDENHHIYAFPFEGGKPKKLIEADENDKYFFAHLSKDGERLYYVTSKDNPQFLKGFVYHISEDRHEELYSGDGAATYIGSVSQDEKYAVIIKFYANTYTVGYLLNLESGEMTAISKDPERVHVFGDAAFISDDEIIYITNDEAEFDYVMKYNIRTGNHERFAEFENESASTLKWHKGSETVYIVTETGVEDFIYKMKAGDSKPERLSSPVTQVDGFTVSKNGNAYLVGRTAVEPFNIYRTTENGEWEKVTDNRVLGVSQEEMVDPEVVSYSSFDGKEIEALWFKAKPEQDNGHVIFWPHGGPQAAERKMFRAMFQCLLNRGYSIFAPNFRGSTGYGATFVKLVERDWGEGPRLDCVAGIEWLFETGKSDRDKLFVLGGSYGGYMTLLLAGRHPEYFKAVIDIFGVSNLFTFVKSVPEHWKPIMDKWVGDPERDKERFEKDSPITYLDSMRKPMLVIQGANDPRVVKEESDQIVEKLKEQGTEVDYLVLDDEGHGFSKKENEIKVYKQIIDFLDKHQ